MVRREGPVVASRGPGVLAGVVAAYTRRYDLNPLVGRILGVVGVLTFTPIAYVVAWVLMPADAEIDVAPVAPVAA